MRCPANCRVKLALSQVYSDYAQTFDSEAPRACNTDHFLIDLMVC